MRSACGVKNISELEESYKRIIDAEELLKSINKELRKERKYNNIVYRFNLYTYYSSFIAIQIKNLFWWKNVTSPILKHDNIHHIDDAVNAKFNPSYKDSIITQINEGIKILERNYKNMIDFYFYNRNTSVRKTNINNKEYIIESHFYLRDNNVKYFVKERFLFFFWRYFRMNRGIYYTNKSYQIEDAYKLYLLENKKYNSKTIITEKEQKAINIIM
jgi:hypothetical protein